MRRLALDTCDKIVDFPTLGIPTKPTSASIFNSTLILRSSPGSPCSDMSGAGLSGVANALLPLPPLPPYAIIASQSPSVKSAMVQSLPT